MEEELYISTNSLNNFPPPLGGLGPITPLRCSAVSLHGNPVSVARKSSDCNVMITFIRHLDEK